MGSGKNGSIKTHAEIYNYRVGAGNTLQREIGDNGGEHEHKGRQGEKLEKIARSTVVSGRGGCSGSPLIEVMTQMKKLEECSWNWMHCS